MRTFLLLAAAAASMAAAPVMAQTVEEHTTVVKKGGSGGAATGAAGGAVAGAMVGGPIGAVVGGVAGATLGHSVDPPTEVRTYVTSQHVAPVTYGHEIVVGKPLEGEITWLDVPNYPKYRWAYVDGERVIVDTDSHKVVAIYQ